MLTSLLVQSNTVDFKVSRVFGTQNANYYFAGNDLFDNIEGSSYTWGFVHSSDTSEQCFSIYEDLESNQQISFK